MTRLFFLLRWLVFLTLFSKQQSILHLHFVFRFRHFCFCIYFISFVTVQDYFHHIYPHFNPFARPELSFADCVDLNLSRNHLGYIKSYFNVCIVLSFIICSIFLFHIYFFYYSFLFWYLPYKICSLIFAITQQFPITRFTSFCIFSFTLDTIVKEQRLSGVSFSFRFKQRANSNKLKFCRNKRKLNPMKHTGVLLLWI